MIFQYTPLQVDEIRLMRLTFYSPNSPPVFRLVNVSLRSEPSYTALSYVWGPPGDVCNIKVDGVLFGVRQNLHDALQQILRSRLIDRYIWVDAICINQGLDKTALDERSIQITRMRQIYEQATEVLVWLGNPTDPVQHRMAFALLDEFQKRFDKTRKAFELKGYRPWWYPKKARSLGMLHAQFLHDLSPTRDKTIFDVPGSRTHQAWLGIVAVWVSSWWTRTWIYQEATVAEKDVTMLTIPMLITPKIPSNIKFVSGDQQTNWNQLVLANMVANHIIETEEVECRLLYDANIAFERVRGLRAVRVIDNVPPSLQLIQMARMTDCADPRDKVYAPLCLASDDVCKAIKPDYAGKTAAELYIDVVRCHLQQAEPNIDFLGYAMHRENSAIIRLPAGKILTLPSWVPNYADKLDIFPIPKRLHISINLDSRQVGFNDQRGTPSNKGETRQAYQPLAVRSPLPCIDDFVLCVTGVFVDEVKDIIAATIPGKTDEQVRQFAREQGIQWHADANQQYFTGETFNAAYTHALVLDLTYDDRNRAAARGGEFDYDLRDKSPADLSIRDIRRRNGMQQARMRAVLCRLTALSQKQYILMVPDTTEVGDLIWAFVRGQALYILRPVDRATNHYTFIGECYAHGLMDGEMDRQLHMGEAVLEQVRLI